MPKIKKSPHEQYCDRIRRAIRADSNQAALARAIGVSRGRVQNMIRNPESVTIGELAALNRAYPIGAAERSEIIKELIWQ